MKYLLAIALGPVQDFIASARRSRDLWFGSWLLSELSRTAARTIVEKQSGDLTCLIFPAITDPQSLADNDKFNVVNKILAVVDNPSEVGTAVRQAIDKRLAQIRTAAYQKVAGNFDRTKAELQVNDLVEFFWAAAPWPEGRDYARVRQEVEYLLAARKTTRNFQSARSWSGFKPKSSLDGQRESVIPENVYQAMRQGKSDPKELRLKYGVREGERLCGVGLLKRHGNRGGDDSFFSTSHVAALPFLQQLTAAHRPALEDYWRELAGLLYAADKKGLQQLTGHVPRELAHPVFEDYDAHLLFSERLADFFDAKKETEQDNLAKARTALQKFLAAAFAGKSPQPYYGLLLADGDRMGKAIDAQQTFQQHRNLSEQLSAFAAKVKTIVEHNHNGSLIYAGGDDVLAFLPLHTALACAQELRQVFAENLQGFPDAEGNTPTLSVGLAVVHHIEPLSDALALARQAEKKAKGVKGKNGVADKNALAVVVDKRSGASRIAAGTWGTLDERLAQFIAWHRAEVVPDGAAYQLRDLALRLEHSEELTKETRDMLDQIKEYEARRILQRKRKPGGAEQVDQAINNALAEFLPKTGKEGKEKKEGLSVAELADELIIAKIFADAMDLAAPSRPTETQAKTEAQHG